MSSPLISRMMFAFRAGLQFAGRRNLYEVFGYSKALTSAILYAKYQRQDIVTRIVDMPPEEMWHKKPTLKEGVKFKDKFEEFAKKTMLWDRIIQADKLCCFGPYSIIMLGLPGDPKSPAPKVTDLKDVAYMTAFGGEAVTIGQWESDPRNPRFGMPKTYKVQVGSGVTGSLNYGQTSSGPGSAIEIHASRAIHIVDRPVQGQLIAEPRLGKVFNILEDMLKIAGGSAELYWILSNRGMQIDVDKDMQMEPADEAALTQELDEFQHGLRRYLRTRGVKVNPLGSETADPRGPFEVTMALLASATGIPQRILMGAEAGQLASEQDRANWAEVIERRRTAFAVPYVLQPVIRQLGALTYIDANSWIDAGVDAWEWPEAFHMNPVEEANAINARARAIVNLARRNQFDAPLISDEEARVMTGFPAEKKVSDEFPEAPEKPNAGPQSEPAGTKGSKTGTTEAPNAIADNSNAGQLSIDFKMTSEKPAKVTVSRSFEAKRQPDGSIKGTVTDVKTVVQEGATDETAGTH